MSAARPMELLVWGATGVTGKRVCLELAKRYTGSVRWCIAGRNEQKLKSLRQELTQLNDSLKELPVIVADVENKESVAAMVQQTQVVVACAGPFPLYSNAVVEACVEGGTHVLDVTGEAQWVKSLIDKLHDKAKKNGVKVINCCGFDSIPADIATFALVDHAYKRYGRGLSKAIGQYAFFSPSKVPFSGGTLASMISVIKLNKEVQKEMSDPFYLNPVDKKPLKSDAADQFWMKYVSELGCWTAPFVMQGCNSRIVHRSAALLSRPYGNGFSYGECLSAGSFLSALGQTLNLFFMLFIIAFPPTRSLFLALGIFPKPGHGPSVKEEEASNWEITVDGFVEPDESNASGQQIRVRSRTSDHFGGYTSTARMVLESAMAIIRNSEELKAHNQVEAGVLTPASALGHVLIKRLNDIGLETTILEEQFLIQ